METKLLQSSLISDHPYFRARKEAYQLPSGKMVDPYFWVELPVSCCAMAITNDHKVILLSQYRHPIGKTLLELPGGFIDSNEDPEIAIARELREETGYTFTDIIPLGRTAANPGVLGNYTFLFLATGGIQTDEQQLDPNEEIALSLHSQEDVKRKLMSGEIEQSMHALCLFYGFSYLEKS